jgi:AraC family transcriptional regulator
MVIQQFDPPLGRYHFVENDLVTALHAHPALELIIAQSGTFQLRSPGMCLTALKMGLVAPNQAHALDATGCTFEIIMVEPGWDALACVLTFLGHPLRRQGIWAIDPATQGADVARLLRECAGGVTTADGLDARVQAAMAFVAAHFDAPQLTLGRVAEAVHLSPSRISHLFKAGTGITVQDYIVWTRMKHAVHLLLKEESNLTQAAHAAGFHDSAHFSKHFKSIFGLSPSMVYNNSRIVQAFEGDAR